jgi:pimeloyl-ACP methyl ester carboxylesterase
MTTAMIDGLEVVYETRGSGPALLMLAPGGFDALWRNGRPPACGKACGRSTRLRASSRSSHTTARVRPVGRTGGKALLGAVRRLGQGAARHVKIERAFVLGGCTGCSVALPFATRYPASTCALVLHWPVGGYRWKINSRDRFAHHQRYARENGLAGVIKRAHEGKSFWQDPEAAAPGLRCSCAMGVSPRLHPAGSRALFRRGGGERAHRIRPRDAAWAEPELTGP